MKDAELAKKIAEEVRRKARYTAVERGYRWVPWVDRLISQAVRCGLMEVDVKCNPFGYDWRDKVKLRITFETITDVFNQRGYQAAYRGGDHHPYITIKWGES